MPGPYSTDPRHITHQIPKRPLPTGRFLRKTEEITMLQQPELLAPAGSLETLKYAVMYLSLIHI